MRPTARAIVIADWITSDRSAAIRRIHDAVGALFTVIGETHEPCAITSSSAVRLTQPRLNCVHWAWC